MSVEVRRARAEERPALFALRHEVFCGEQGVPLELERDRNDAAALHLVALDDGRVVGTCRLVTAEEPWRLGRMAVQRDRRGRGVGRELMRLAHEEARRAGAGRVALAAQLTARSFYEGLGYTARGVEFEEAGIMHVAMTKDLEG